MENNMINTEEYLKKLEAREARIKYLWDNMCRCLDNMEKIIRESKDDNYSSSLSLSDSSSSCSISAK